MNKRWYLYGLALIFVAILFDQPLLVVVGVLMFVIIGVTDVWAKYCLYNLNYQRHFSEQRVLFGEEVTVSLVIENAKLLPLPWVEIADNVPHRLSFPGQSTRVDLATSRLLLEHLFNPYWYERITRRYSVQCNARGVHTFGPTIVRSGDIFGFVTREETLPNWQFLLVYPLIVPLTRFGLPSRHPFGERQAPRRLLEDPSRVVGVRDYSYGDSLRRVNWKATARTMQLQSKVYEASTTYTLILFLSVASQLDQWYGIHPEREELAVCAAASVANWAFDQGYAVGLYSNSLMFRPEESLTSPPEGEQEAEEDQSIGAMVAAQLKRRRMHFPPGSSPEQRVRIMEALARTQSYFGTTIEEVIQAERSRLPFGATVVVITDAISDLLLESLALIRRSGHAVTILFVGKDSPTTNLAGIPIYILGAEETWRELKAAYSNAPEAIPLVKPSPSSLQL
jgi:uncharacterized protein (DUF58 family)